MCKCARSEGAFTALSTNRGDYSTIPEKSIKHYLINKNAPVSSPVQCIRASGQGHSMGAVSMCSQIMMVLHNIELVVSESVKLLSLLVEEKPLRRATVNLVN